MLKEIVMASDVHNFGEMWNLMLMGDEQSIQRLMAVLGASEGIGDSGFVVETMEIYGSPVMKAICCYDRQRRGRYFVGERVNKTQSSFQYILTGVSDFIIKQQLFFVDIDEGFDESAVKEVSVLADSTGWVPVFVGKSDEKLDKLIEIYITKRPAINMTEEVGLVGLISLMRYSRLFLGGTNGLSLIARLLKIPAVAFNDVESGSWRAQMEMQNGPA